MSRVANWYFFVLGVLFFLFAIGHASFGHANVLSVLWDNSPPARVSSAIFYSWHTPTAENAVFALMLFGIRSTASRVNGNS